MDIRGALNVSKYKCAQREKLYVGAANFLQSLLHIVEYSNKNVNIIDSEHSYL